MADQIINVTSCTAIAIPLDGVESVTYDDGGDSIENKADGDLYGTAQILVNGECTGSISGINQEVFASVPRGTQGSIIAIGTRISDGVLVTITFSLAMALKNSGGLSHADKGAAGLDFKCMSSDGQVSPVAYTTP